MVFYIYGEISNFIKNFALETIISLQRLSDSSAFFFRRKRIWLQCMMHKKLLRQKRQGSEVKKNSKMIKICLAN
jgi:hypothetical protein